MELDAMASDQELNQFLFDDTIESMLEEAVFQPANGSEASTSDQLTALAAVSLFANASAMDTSPDIPTPPPDTPPKEHTQHYYFSTNPVTAATDYVRGSSLEESPPPSPGNNETSGKEEGEDDSSDGASSGHIVHSDRESSESSDEDGSAEKNVPMNVKLPQRKGGMQLWQFLYTLLCDPDKKYGDLIEWTSNSREFRLLEPEAIAIWWGEHKNKRNMSYDKLSRSLRYYYDKGIIKKITGERYVYQFCIDPEMMYKHIGNSDCRPKLKPMPVMARHATSKYQNQPERYNLFPQDPLCVAQGPVSLSTLHPPTCPPFSNNDIPFLHTHSFATPPPPPPPPPYPTYENSFMNEPDMDTPPPHFEFGHFDNSIKSSLPIRRCRSHNSMTSYELSMYEQAGQLFPPHSPYHSLSQTPPLMSPLARGDSSPRPLPPNYPIPVTNADEFDFNMLDELITSMESFSTQSPPMICTSPHSNMPVWNFS